MLCCIAMLYSDLMGCREKRDFLLFHLEKFFMEMSFWYIGFISLSLNIALNYELKKLVRALDENGLLLLSVYSLATLFWNCFFLYAKCFNYFWIILLLKSWKNLITVCHWYERNVVCQASSKHLKFQGKMLFIHYSQPQAVWGEIAKWFST